METESMKPEMVRRRVTDYTKREMILQGVNRLTMDVIAQGMGMSKRTLYQLFPSKVCLVRICLSELIAQTRNQLLVAWKQGEQTCVEMLFRTIDAYVDLLHCQGKTLLEDLACDADYRPLMERERAFWMQQLADALNFCRAYGWLLEELDPDEYALEVLTLLYENCLRGGSLATQRFLGRALLRGVFKSDSLRSLDECFRASAPYAAIGGR